MLIMLRLDLVETYSTFCRHAESVTHGKPAYDTYWWITKYLYVVVNRFSFSAWLIHNVLCNMLYAVLDFVIVQSMKKWGNNLMDLLNIKLVITKPHRINFVVLFYSKSQWPTYRIYSTLMYVFVTMKHYKNVSRHWEECIHKICFVKYHWE